MYPGRQAELKSNGETIRKVGKYELGSAPKTNHLLANNPREERSEIQQKRSEVCHLAYGLLQPSMSTTGARCAYRSILLGAP